MEDILEIIKQEMIKLGIDYHYLYNSAPEVKYPYVTGEFTQSGYSFEDGTNSGDMLLEIWNRGPIKPIIEVLETIKNNFRDFRAVKNNKTAHISFNSATPVRTNDESLNKYEVHMDVFYWEGE